MNELAIQTEVNLDKNDVTAIAVAEAEKRIRARIRGCQQLVEDYDRQINELNEQFELETKTYFEKKVSKTFQNISKKIAATQLGLKAELKIKSEGLHSGYLIRKTHQMEKFNTVTINIYKKEFGSMPLFNEQHKPLAFQYKIKEQLDALKAKKAEAAATGVQWQQKKSDIPALERQMRAHVAKAEINKTKTGKALIDTMMKNLDNTIKMIGM
jgi:hypothetical protein